MLDEEGHPFSNEEDHGIGTRSVLNFINKTDSEIRYIAEEKTFKVRMLEDHIVFFDELLLNQ